VPLGKELVVIVIESDALTVRLNDFVAVNELTSVTRTVKLLVPVPVGVPEIAPVLDPSPTPAGKVPETMDQVYGVVPPVAASVAL
jgi:CxxC motif-containing protein